MAKRVRTRIAPSPTGPFHMGTARTALFCYLYAKKHGGDFLVRVEDTDKERSEKKWEKDALENMEFLGIEWDEGPLLEEEGSKGPHGPYRQSERTEIYAGYLSKLLEDKKAYPCFCSTEDLEASRRVATEEKKPPVYPGTCRNLSAEQQEEFRKQGKREVIRFRVEQKEVSFSDLIRGTISFNMSLSGDIVIAKDMETPLYNFTVVVDDYLMEISHVIRGEDHIPNTPKQILLQEALGFPAVEYAHLPLLLGEDRTKLSKRHGNNSVSRFREEGYLPEAIVNFLALLGWNPGTEEEVFSLHELVEKFSLEHIQKGGAIFNVQRLEWMNGLYIRKQSVSDITQLCIPFLVDDGLLVPVFEEASETPGFLGQEHPQFAYKVAQSGVLCPAAVLESMILLYHERLKKLGEISELIDFFFKHPSYEPDLLKWKDSDISSIRTALEALIPTLENISEDAWTKEAIEAAVMPQAEQLGNRGVMLWPFRVSLSGKKASAGPFEIAAILGKHHTLSRVRHALSIL